MKITSEMLNDTIKKADETRIPKYLELPPMNKQGKLKYVLFHHWRKGKSVHWDLRIEVNNHLIGYTILDNPTVPSEVESLEQAKKYSFTLPFKLKPTPGMEGLKCRVEDKARQPKEWLFWKENYCPSVPYSFNELWNTEIGEGFIVDSLEDSSPYTYYSEDEELAKFIRQKGEEWCVYAETTGKELGCHPTREDALTQLRAIEASKHRKLTKMDIGEGLEFSPGTVGATRYGYGRFILMDKGYATFGTQKVWYNEYFLESLSKGKGKYSFNNTRLNARAVKQPYIDPETKRPVTGKWEIVWDIWVPKDQEPYATGKRAQEEKWFPPKNFIPIPQYWKEDNEEKYEEWLETAKAHWSGRKEILKTEANYVLHQLSWKGQKVIRDIPTLRWYLSLDMNGVGVRSWELRDNPLYNQPTMAMYLGKMEKKWFDYEGTLKPGQFVYPLKRLEAKLASLARGTALLESSRVDGKELITIRAKTGELTGIWTLTQEERASEIYSLSQEEVSKESAAFVLQKHSWDNNSHFDIRLDEDKEFLTEWSLRKNPAEFEKDELEEVLPKKCWDKTWMTTEGKKKVGNVDTYIEKLDEGTVDIIEDTQNFRSFRFHGEKLKGIWNLRNTGKGWIFQRSLLPGGRLEKTIEVEEKKEYIVLHLHDIRDFVACESEAKIGLYDIPKLPENVQANICAYPRLGTIHGVKIQALYFSKPEWDIEKVKSFDYHSFQDWDGVQIRGVKEDE